MFQTTDDSKDIYSILLSHVEMAVLLPHKKVNTHISVNVKIVEGNGPPFGKISEKAEEYRISQKLKVYGRIL